MRREGKDRKQTKPCHARTLQILRRGQGQATVAASRRSWVQKRRCGGEDGVPRTQKSLAGWPAPLDEASCSVPDYAQNCGLSKCRNLAVIIDNGRLDERCLKRCYHVGLSCMPPAMCSACVHPPEPQARLVSPRCTLDLIIPTQIMREVWDAALGGAAGLTRSIWQSMRSTPKISVVGSR
ncbi:uncharacterized protein CC84DRAFT_500923 [Paraphaeosphaeria sporulosa]|uniref:Uncharacterized protein n=1 Tax=Paraphaeosphaeria sporulosa TaxID=1460663 RepID=A0A177CVN0_9PLEO|nr:uncharacterized protein CC84DRAFT_500923 [Paraphaeosphaeria sporulosa]OAG10952.1 hypothetical protein CC84DRAFT_500923 [Paraphaeosphaeria sporulosa]